MAVALVTDAADTLAVAAAGDEISVALAGVSAGDFGVAWAGWSGRLLFSDSGPLAAPDGWELWASTPNLVLYVRLMDGTETDVAVQWQANSGNAQLHASVWSGASGAQLDDNQATGTASTPTKPAVTLNDDGVVVAARLVDTTTAALPTGFTGLKNTYEDGASFATGQRLRSCYKLAAAGLDAQVNWGPATGTGEDWITMALAAPQLGLYVGEPQSVSRAGSAAVPSPNGYGRLPQVLEQLPAEVLPERTPSRDVPLPTWRPGDPGDPYRTEEA